MTKIAMSHKRMDGFAQNCQQLFNTYSHAKCVNSIVLNNLFYNGNENWNAC